MCLVAPGAGSEVQQGGKFGTLEFGIITGAGKAGLPFGGVS